MTSTERRSAVSYDSWLVEEAVCRAANDFPLDDQRLFRRERDRIYELPDEEVRELSFRTFHREWFVRLGLDAPIERALATRPDVFAGIRSCRVMSAGSRKEELADLLFEEPSGPPMLLLRLRPEAFLDAVGLLAFLHHELLHVADMLDPAFGYEAALPPSDEGPAYDNILRDRYRVLWDTTIDGRLVRAGLIDPTVRDARLGDFAAAFPEAWPSLNEEFARWFDAPRPTHRALATFVLTPRPSAGRGPYPAQRRCPVCRFPVAVLDPHPERLSPAARRAIQARHPSWDIESGVCSQCADLYDVRTRGIGSG